MYVWMEVRRYVCINVTYCERGGAWLQVSLHLSCSLCVCLCVCELWGGETERESHVSACLLLLVLVPCSLLSTGTGTVPGTGTGAGYGVPGYLARPRVGPRNGLGQSGSSPSLGREAGVRVGQAGRQALQGRSGKVQSRK